MKHNAKGTPIATTVSDVDEEAFRLGAERTAEWERTFDAVPDLVAIIDRQRRLVRVNRAMADRLGVSREQCVGHICHKLVHGTELPPQECPHRLFELDGCAHTSAIREARLGSDLVVTVSPLCDFHGQVTGCVHIARDITEERRHQHERESTLELLRLLNEQNDTRELLRNLTGFLQEWTGCEAVGIRMREGDDFPYYETRGFSAEFLEAENQLCVRSLDGQLERDGDGNPCLACMCGNILCGRFDPALPFFTSHGSFWTNSTSRLLSGATKAERQSQTRNRCNGEGYESVALVPLRHANRTLGLLQLNDRAPGRFAAELISFLENAGDQIAIALAQRQAQEALRESEEQFRGYFEMGLVGMAIMSPDRKWIHFNEYLCRMLGYSRGELATLDWMEITHPEDLAADVAQFRRVLAGKIDSYTIEKRYVHKNGTTVSATLSFRCIRNAQGSVSQLVALIMDTTQRKLAEEEQHRLQQQLTHVARLSTLGEMVAGIAHDVNQPLYSILNYAKACGNILKQEDERNDKLLLWTEQIAAEATRAGEIIKRMRGLARKDAVRRLPNSVAEVIEESLALIAFEMRRLQVRVCKDFSASPPWASFDRIQIQQVLINLLRNACEALEQTPPNERALTIRVAAKEAYVEISILDTGPGLHDMDAARVFDAFVTSKPAGLGMGLAISKSIVEAHGGHIWAAGNPGGGAALCFTLPLTRGERTHA